MPNQPVPRFRRSLQWRSLPGFVLLVLAMALSAASAHSASPEKSQLTLGFIKLTDMAPLAIAKENGYFADEGLDVTLRAQKSWQALLDNVLSGDLDGAHMLAGQPLAATIGVLGDGEIITPYSLDRNGNGITVSSKVWQTMKLFLPVDERGRVQHPITADALRPAIIQLNKRGLPMLLGMVFPVSTHNYELRYWLAAGGIHPGFYSKTDNEGSVLGEVELMVFPPPFMPTALKAQMLDGYCVGEPWNQQAVNDRTGVPLITNHDIWPHNPEKVFGVTKAFADKNPETVKALTKALIRAGKWLDADNGANREAAVEILRRPEYVGAGAKVLRASMTGTFEYERGDRRPAPDFNVFFRDFASYPYYSDAVWFLTQMRRWGQIREYKPDEWYIEAAKRVYRPDIYLDAAEELVAEGKADRADFPWDSDGFRRQPDAFIDGNTFNASQPNAYLNKFDIGLKRDQRVVGERLVDGKTQ